MSRASTGALVVLAAGLSSRMKKSAAERGAGSADTREALERSKSMIGVGKEGRPLLDYLLANARDAGYGDIVIVVGEGDEEIRARYARPEPALAGVAFSFAVQPIPPGRTKPAGTADALLRAMRARPDWRGGKFTVCNSDNLYSREAMRRLLESPHPCALIDYDRDALRFTESRIAQFAVLEKDARGFLTGIIEKPSPEEIARVQDAGGRVGVSMNIWRFSYDMIAGALEAVPFHPVRQEKELPVAVGMMIREHPGSMFAIPLAEYVPDLTSVEDIEEVRRFLAAHQ